MEEASHVEKEKRQFINIDEIAVTVQTGSLGAEKVQTLFTLFQHFLPLRLLLLPACLLFGGACPAWQLHSTARVPYFIIQYGVLVDQPDEGGAVAPETGRFDGTREVKMRL